MSARPVNPKNNPVFAIIILPLEIVGWIATGTGMITC